MENKSEESHPTHPDPALPSAPTLGVVSRQNDPVLYEYFDRDVGKPSACKAVRAPGRVLQRAHMAQVLCPDMP